MMAVIEPLAVLPDPVHAEFQTLAKEQFSIASTAQSTVGGIHYELPVHGFLAVEEMAIQDESQRFVLLVIRLGDA